MFFSIFGENLSGPLALFGFSPFNSLRTPMFVIDISSICLKGLLPFEGGKEIFTFVGGGFRGSEGQKIMSMVCPSQKKGVRVIA